MQTCNLLCVLPITRLQVQEPSEDQEEGKPGDDAPTNAHDEAAARPDVHPVENFKVRTARVNFCAYSFTVLRWLRHITAT